MTVGEALTLGRERLRAFGADGRFDSLRLLEEVVGRNAAWIFAHGDAPLGEAARARYVAGLARRAAGEPLAYVVGSAGFFGRSFGVTPDVLVPRPETEMLVEFACEAMRERGLAAPHLCDVGTGSGILAITLACELPDARIDACDRSPTALAVARSNAAALGVGSRVRFFEADARSFRSADGARYDCIVANLPYVKSADLDPMPPGLGAEPRLALDGGADGLDVYGPFLASVRASLTATGLLLLEAGADTTDALAGLATQRFGASACVHVHRDYAGHARVVDVRFEAGADAPARPTERERFWGPPKPRRP